IFWCVSYYSVAFGTLWLPYNTQCKTGQTGAKVRATKSRWNFSNKRTQSTPLDTKLLFSCILFYLGTFGTVWFPYSVQNGQNWCKSSCHEVASEFLATNTTDLPPLDP